MALYHFHMAQVKRSAGQSAVASAAYRAGEKLYSDYYGESSDYTRKGGVVCSEILLPSHAPPEYADRQTLWNAVENAERRQDAQLAHSFDIALQNEFSIEENVALARQFLSEQFVSRGMIVDFAVHLPDRKDGMYSVLSGHWMNTANGEQNKDFSTDWMRMEIASWARTANRLQMRFQQQIGANLKRWKHGGQRGQNCATKSLQRKIWTAE